MYNGIQIVAEVKTMSPYGFKSDKSFEELLEIALEVGDIISIHTDPRWGGKLNDISRVKKLTDKPVLAKGIHTTLIDFEMCLNAGADLVLTLDLVLKNHIHKNKVWVEPLSRMSYLYLLEHYPSCNLVWNTRCLLTGKEKPINIKDIISNWWPNKICQASMITCLDDIHPDVNAVLIGEHLPQVAKELQCKNQM